MPSFTLEDPQIDLLKALSALHYGGKYSDLTVTCNYRRWAVHRAIVCSRSGFFDGACGSQFREAESRVIDLSEDDQDAVEQMIYFFYHLDYLNQPERTPVQVFRHRAASDARRKMPKKLNLSMVEDPLLAAAGFYKPQHPQTPPQSPTLDARSPPDFSDKRCRSPSLKVRSRSSTLESEAESDYQSYEDEGEGEASFQDDAHLLLHTRVYALAEKYDIPSLKALAKQKFETALACHYDSPELPDALAEVYCSTIDTDRGLRDTVIEAFKAHPQLASTADVFAVIKETPSLALELYKLERGIPPTASTA